MFSTLFIDWRPELEAFHLGSFGVRWYSLMWVIGLIGGYLIVKRLYRQQGIPQEKFEPLFLYCFLGVLIGARLGHCLFYEPEYFLTSGKGLVEMFLPIRFAEASWDWKFTGYTGLASHGGTIGLFLALLVYVKRYKVNFLLLLDDIAIATPFVAGCIRIGNLMNSEIIGTQTAMPWGFIFHTNDALVDGMLVPRHPAQLYEALAYFLIFAIQWRIYKRQVTKSPNHQFANSQLRSSTPGWFFGFTLAAIFTFRFFVEFLKVEQVDFEKGMPLDMGQLLSIPFIAVGLYFLLRKPKTGNSGIPGTPGKNSK